MEFKSQHGQDNINYMSECPAQGMHFTGTIYNNRKHNKKIMKDNKIKSSHEYRKFLTKNALAIMKKNYEARINYNNSVNRCKVSPHGGIVDHKGVIGSDGEDNMQSKPAQKFMMETRCNSNVPACQKVQNHSHDLEIDMY